MISKPNLRHRINDLRQAMSRAQVIAASEAIAAHLLTLPVVVNARTIFVYVSTAEEVQTHDLIRRWLADGRTLGVPVTVGRSRMQVHRITSFDDLVPGSYGICVPKEPCLLETDPEVCITPCLAVSPNGDRLGHGGGYYDRYISQHPSLPTVALAFDEQLVDNIPTTSTDRSVQTIVTPSGVIECT